MTDIINFIESAGLTGRGGAAFPTATKLRAAGLNRAQLIVNACDGEIGAAKDAWVVATRLPELVEGTELLRPAGSPAPLFAAHRDSVTARILAREGLPVLEVPDRYVSSEESALVSLAHGWTARPIAKTGHTAEGFRDGRGRRVHPTLVLNAETVWRAAQIARRGVDWFRAQGTAAEPGPRLVSVGGHVRRPTVVETAAGTPLTELLEAAGGPDPAARYLGIGGLGGVVVGIGEALGASWQSSSLARFGASTGPGILTVWDPAQDPLDTVSQLLAFGASESAGQCGPCMFGLPALETLWSQFRVRPDRRTETSLVHGIERVEGRGACHHPDGVAHFLRSAVRVFGPELMAGAGLDDELGLRPPARRAPQRPPVAVDRTLCTGHGICAQTLPGLVKLDEWGYPLIRDGEASPGEVDAAVALCPARALRRV